MDKKIMAQKIKNIKVKERLSQSSLTQQKVKV